MSKIISDNFENIKEILSKISYELYDLELEKTSNETFFRVIITKKDGITIEDCVIVTKELNTYLDEKENFFPENYMLEVTSPGIERVLKRKEHFESALEEKIKVKFYQKNDLVDKKEYVGILKKYDSEKILVDTYEFMLKDITKINTIFDLKEKR